MLDLVGNPKTGFLMTHRKDRFSHDTAQINRIPLYYNRRTGVMRTAGSKHHEHGIHKHNPMKAKRKPPRGMYLNKEDIQPMVSGPPGQPEALVKALDTELVTLKRQVLYIY